MINTEEFTGKDLKELRKKYKLTQKELAKNVGTEQSRISEWENEVSIIPNMAKYAFSAFFGSLEK